MKYLDLSDRDYVRKRNKLCRHAAAYADKRVDEVLVSETDQSIRDTFWNKVFSRRMDIMAFDAGLTSWRPK